MTKRSWLLLTILLGLPIIGLTSVLFFRSSLSVNTTNLPANTLSTTPQPQGAWIREDGWTLPSGFDMQVFATGLTAPRVLTLDPQGRLVASIPSIGQVVALQDSDGDGVAENTTVIARGLDRPHGLLFRCESEISCSLYVAQLREVTKYDYDPISATATNPQSFLSLPGGGRHNTRTLHPHTVEGQEGMLISIGSTCDVCFEANPLHGTVQFTPFENPTLQPFATGLRNAVFLTTHPVTGDILATEMGRDNLGDDLPPDEVNVLQQGRSYGWPFCYGDNVFDLRFSSDPSACGSQTPAHIQLPAHVAPLGLGVIPEEGWPQEYWFDLLVAYHGSWNRSFPDGYRIERIDLDTQGRPTGNQTPFIRGWLQDSQQVIGRPVDILIQPGGVIYISDDDAGVIYRVFRTPSEDL